MIAYLIASLTHSDNFKIHAERILSSGALLVLRSRGNLRSVGVENVNGEIRHYNGDPQAAGKR